jgi:2'-5' RNA ligase
MGAKPRKPPMPKKPRRKFGPSQKDRIFFAALPDAATAARLYARAEVLKKAHDLKGTLIQPEHLHVTLFHLGDWAVLPDEIVKLASKSAAEAGAAPFDVAFHKVGSFPNRTGIYPLVLTGDAGQWSALHGALAAALKRNGLGGATQGEFEPHVTLVYDGKRIKSAKIEPVGWTVRDFVLVHSRLGRTTHVHLGRWPLEGRA